MGGEQRRVGLAEYDAGWPRLFEEEAARIRDAVGDWVLAVEHIGSTSVPGMPAKPIIDIAVAVRSFGEAVRCVAPLEQVGYTYRGEWGMPRRHYFVKGEPRTHHLHMLEAGTEQWDRHIRFRDTLRASPELAAEYAALKRRLAAPFARDRDAYQAGKALFIGRVERL
jgi:GrpB-like predicted nucleotidyltransferase (UPF0157 family)